MPSFAPSSFSASRVSVACSSTVASAAPVSLASGLTGAIGSSVTVASGAGASGLSVTAACASASTAAAVGDSLLSSSAASAVAPVGAVRGATRVPRARSASPTADWARVRPSTSSMIAIGALSPLRGPSLTMRV